MPQTHSPVGTPTTAEPAEPFTGPDPWRAELEPHTPAILEVGAGVFCQMCLEDWPCNPARALATLETQWAERR